MAETRLRYMRKKYGVSQEKLAEYAGISLRALKSYDSGERSINKAACQTVKDLADVLGCQMEEIMEMPEEERTVWYVVIDDDTKHGCDAWVESFQTLEEAKDHADYTYNHLTGAEIRKRQALYVLKTDEKDSWDGDVVYSLI